MRTWAILLTFVLALVTLFPACQGPAENLAEVTPVSVRDGVFVHISSGTAEPHRVLMGLRMARVMSSDKDVLVYFDIKGVEVVLKDSEGIAFGGFDSSKTQLQDLIDKGVTIYVCPTCLAAAGKTAEDLLEGVQIAEKDMFFSFTSGRILTLDY